MSDPKLPVHSAFMVQSALIHLGVSLISPAAWVSSPLIVGRPCVYECIWGLKPTNPLLLCGHDRDTITHPCHLIRETDEGMTRAPRPGSQSHEPLAARDCPTISRDIATIYNNKISVDVPEKGLPNRRRRTTIEASRHGITIRCPAADGLP
jgi:hypothetical protein